MTSDLEDESSNFVTALQQLVPNELNIISERQKEDGEDEQKCEKVKMEEVKLADVPSKPTIKQNLTTKILVSQIQKGNPILPYIQNVQWEFVEIEADYQVGLKTCVLFSSLLYHQKYPNCLLRRIEKLRDSYDHRILLIFCDDEDEPELKIKQLTKLAFDHKLTILIGWNLKELARYLELFKLFENRSPDWIRERIQESFQGQYLSSLTKIKGINKTNVFQLAIEKGSFSEISKCSFDQLTIFSGIGQKKSLNIFNTFHKPFQIENLKTFRERNIFQKNDNSQIENEVTFDEDNEEFEKMLEELTKEQEFRLSFEKDDQSIEKKQDKLQFESEKNTSDFTKFSFKSLSKEELRQIELENDIQEFDNFFETLDEQEILQLDSELSQDVSST